MFFWDTVYIYKHDNVQKEGIKNEHQLSYHWHGSSLTSTSAKISLTARFMSVMATSTSRISVPRPMLSRIAFAAMPSGMPLASNIGDSLAE